MIREAARRSAEETAALARAKAQEVPESTGVQQVAADLDARAKKIQDLLNEGRGDEVYKMLQQDAIGPQSEALRRLAIAQAERNIEDLRRVYGKKFTDREAAFRAKQRELGVRDEHLYDPKHVQQLFKLVCIDDPNYFKEEADAELARREEENRKRLEDAPPALSPVHSHLRPETKDKFKEMAEKYLSKDPETLEMQLRNLAAYGVSVEAYLRQAAKADDPRFTYGAGFGEFYRPIFTEIANPAEEPTT